MNAEDNHNQSRFAWRPATRADIGSVARFGDANWESYTIHDWIYGILIEINQTDSGFQYVSDESYYLHDSMHWACCQIQYDPNQEP